MKPRHILLALALAVTLAAVFWPAPKAPEVVGAVVKQNGRVDKRSASTIPGVAGVDALRLSTLRQPDASLGALRADLFPAQTWRPPPPPAPKRVALPLPASPAPPLPFQYLGHWREGGKDVIFLAQGNQVLQVQVGDALAGWHLDQATDAALTFTWTALNMQQILRISP
ncbi:MAG: hypothetical protein Q8Q28_09770 [Pseudomonadota bacterium]|nr:hypothetical protein [Pseudomonadota bacterium]